MSFADHVILWLHVAAAVFTIGPGTAAIMSTPRFVRKKNIPVVRYLFRTTRIYSFAALLTLIFGLILTAMTHRFSQWWISVSLTLFVVAFVLLILVIRDQSKALAALEAADRAERMADGTVAGASEATGRSRDQKEARAEADGSAAAQPTTTVGRDLRVAAVERGRIASIGGLTALIWLVILMLMAWH
jgi:Ca2+/Na+ antiporter